MENSSAEEINNYFGWEFSTQLSEFGINEDDEIYNYLNEAFYDIDTSIPWDENNEKRVFETLRTAINMIE